MEAKLIYLDNSATTKPLSEVLEIEKKCNETNFFNCSSSYFGGVDSNKLLKCARTNISKILNCENSELLFSPSGTIANNAAIFGGVKNKQGRALCFSLEHPSVYNCFLELKNKGYDIEFIKANNFGAVDIENFKQLMTKNVYFVSIMHVNNVTGAINDIGSISKIIKNQNKNCIFHSDGVQAFTKVPVNLKNLDIDLYTVSAHKLNGIKGSAALFKRKNLNLSPHIFGGGQESNVFSGTENLGAVLGFEFAVNFHYKNFDLHFKHLSNLKNYLTSGLKAFRNVYILDKDKGFSPHILNVSFKNVKAEVLQQQLSNDGIYIGIGSACNKTSKEKRYLTPLNLEKGYFDGNIRLSLDYTNTEKEIDEFLQKLKGALKIYD